MGPHHSAPVFGNKGEKVARVRLVRALVAVLVSMVVAPAGHALADRGGDGVYDRLAGDLTLGFGAGPAVTFRGGDVAAGATLELRMLIVDAAGPVLAARWGPDAGELAFVGVELQVLHPAIWLLDADLRRERLDLFLQSFSVELGAALGPLDGDVGVGLGVGVAMEVPLVLPSAWAHGLWLRVGARRVRASPSDRAGPATSGREWTLMATLAIKAPVRLGLGGWDPPRYRVRE